MSDVHGLYIGGDWRLTAAANRNLNPSDVSEVVGLYACGEAADVAAAVEAARSAQPLWMAGGLEARFAMLDAIGQEIIARKEDLGRLLAREEGKTLAEGVDEAQRASSIFRYFADEALRVRGDCIPSIRSGVDIEVTREPVGVVGLITPWNFPLAIPAWKIAPALAFGNAVVFKPAELVPAAAWALTDIIARSGIPKGLFNLVMGSGSRVGAAILDHPGIDAISFTGSVEVGRTVAVHGAQRFAKVQCELGGKNPLIVLDDADIEIAVEVAVNGAFFSTGQRCTATSRIIVTDGIYARFMDALLARTQALKVGHALDATTHIGPVVDERQLAQDLEYIDIGRREGARLLCGGIRVQREHRGHYFAPAIFADVEPQMRIAREEIFGPVAAVIRVKGYEEALEIANATDFGLSSGICTTSLKWAADFKRRSQAGLTMVNLPTAGVDYHAALSGKKRSGYGAPEQGRYAAEFYMNWKSAYTRAS